MDIPNAIMVPMRTVVVVTAIILLRHIRVTALISLQPGQYTKIYDTNAASPVLAASRVFLSGEC